MSERHLIPGVVIERTTGTSFGAILEVTDGRGTPDEHRLRTAFLFDNVGRTSWIKKLRENLNRIAGINHLPHVSQPLEIGMVDSASLYVMTARHNASLTDRLGHDGIKDDKDKKHAWQVIEQVTVGLAALHQNDLAHGGLHPGSIGLDVEGAVWTAWIVDAGWGKLYYWSGGAHPPQDAGAYWAQECLDNPTRERLQREDVYALGKIALRLLVGNVSAENHEACVKVLAKIRDRRVKIIGMMLSEQPDQRPTIAQVQRLFAECHVPSVPWRGLSIGMAAALLGASVLAGVVGVRLSDATANLNQASTANNEAIEILKSKDIMLTSARSDVDKLQAELARLRAKLNDKASAQQQISANEVNKNLAAENGDLRREIAKLKKVAALDHERGAEEEWRRIAKYFSSNEVLMHEYIDLHPVEAVKDRLEQWRRAINKPPQNAATWSIRPTVGRARKSGLGVSRILKVTINDGTPHVGKRHPWETETEHRYPTESDAEHRNHPDTWIDFAWKPGDRITINLYHFVPGLIYGDNEKLAASQTFDGPLALWRVFDEGLKDANGVTMEFEIYLMTGRDPHGNLIAGESPRGPDRKRKH